MPGGYAPLYYANNVTKEMVRSTGRNTDSKSASLPLAFLGSI
jgi:hypothetical protein